MLAVVATPIIALFLTTCAGFLAAKLGYLDMRTTPGVNKLLINICLPCMIVSSAVGGSEVYGPQTVGIALLTSAGLCVFLLLVGLLMNAIMRWPQENRGLCQYMAMIGNFGFMCFPVVGAFLGTEAMFLNSVVTIFINVLSFVSAAVLMSPRTESGRPKVGVFDILTPGVIASLLAIAMFLTGFRLPGFLEAAVENVGSITSPLAMMIIGASLADVRPETLVTDWKLHVFALVRQLVIPLAVWFALLPFFPDRTVLTVLVLVLSMPVAAITIVFAHQYKQDVGFAARAITVTTLWSFAILPVIAAVVL